MALFLFFSFLFFLFFFLGNVARMGKDVAFGWQVSMEALRADRYGEVR